MPRLKKTPFIHRVKKIIKERIPLLTTDTLLKLVIIFLRTIPWVANISICKIKKTVD